MVTPDNMYLIMKTMNFTYITVIGKTAINDYCTYINTFPSNDPPEIFGLHANADSTYGSVTQLVVMR